MSDTFDDKAFETYIGDSQENAADEEAFAANLNRFRFLAAENGVELGDGGRALDPEEDVIIVSLATALTMVQVAQSEGADLAALTNIKKRLQAGYILQDADPLWVEIVAQEFPGDSLGDGDEALIAEVIQEQAAGANQLERTYQEIYKGIVGLLAEEGLITLSETEIAAVEQLAFILATRQGPTGSPDISLVEEVRVVLLGLGLNITPPWQRILDLLSASE